LCYPEYFGVSEKDWEDILEQIPVSYHALLDGDLLNESSRSCFPTWRGLISRTAL
jgi:hypothetical protein